MHSFNVTAPNWNEIAQAEVTASPTLNESNQVLIETSVGQLLISPLGRGVRIQSGAETFERTQNYKMLCSVPQIEASELTTSEKQTTISWQNWTLDIQHSPFSFELQKNGKTIQQSATDGHFVRRYRVPPLAKTETGWFLGLELSSSEPVYGLGEKWSGLNKRGQLLRSYNHDALGVNAEISYKNTPFAWSPEGWGVFVHTASPVTHAVGHASWSQRAYGLLVESEELDLFLFDGENGASFIEHYCDLTGFAPTPPSWSAGLILSKAYYRTADELLKTAKAVRDKKMPCDVITLDGRAWQDTDTRFAFEWDETRYPNPKQIIDQLKEMNFKICIWEYPLVSVQNQLFDEMAEKGWLLKDKRTGLAYRYQWDISAFGEVLTPLPESGIVDFTHPDAFAFWKESHKPLFDLGIDMIKADFGEQVEDDNMLASNGASGNELHNVYSLLYNRCVYEAAKEYSANGAFLFSRSAWIGSQQYPSQWGGDPQADWGGLAGSVRGALSWGLSGAPFYATDVGGFYKDTRDDELYVRWCQAGIFAAHMRLHGIGQREPWEYSTEACDAANKALKLRYQLIPYIWKTMEQATQSGLPAQRAMVLAYPNDRAAWAFEDQYMFGDDLLFAPCLKAGGEVEFYLPEGQWRQFGSNKVLSGNKAYKLKLELEEIALFAREGASIPLAQTASGEEIQYSGQIDYQNPKVTYF
ncbi:alpha-xylosidase [Alteromonadaceae bacterium M269]|nr:alpha-xylosidase [Alteromonadaceae bacterium M269]